jgi:hypothetical protein
MNSARKRYGGAVEKATTEESVPSRRWRVSVTLLQPEVL